MKKGRNKAREGGAGRREGVKERWGPGRKKDFKKTKGTRERGRLRAEGFRKGVAGPSSKEGDLRGRELIFKNVREGGESVSGRDVKLSAAKFL